MSNANEGFTGSAARQHESTGGNIPAEKANLPAAGDAARDAEARRDSTGDAYGAGAVSREQFRDSAAIRVPQFRGVRLVEGEKPLPDLSARTAADYLPAQFKAQLMAEGRLSPDGKLQERPKVSEATHPAQSEEPQPSTAIPETVAPPGVLARVARLFRKLFGKD